MKKIAIFNLFFLLLNASLCHAADSARHFNGSGEVISVDPVYSQITLSHGAIKGFAQEGVTEFYIADSSSLKGIAKGDLVDIEIKDTKGDVKINKITKTGVAPQKQDGVPIGQAVRDTLQGTGNVLGAVTSPIPPVSDAFHGAMGSAADAADPKIQDGKLKQKASF